MFAGRKASAVLRGLAVVGVLAAAVMTAGPASAHAVRPRVTAGTGVTLLPAPRLVTTAVAGSVLKARHSGKCLEVYHSSFSSGANVDQWTCNGTATQHWYVYLVGYSGSSNIYEIVNVNSNLCLNVAGGSTADGANVEQHTCGTAAAPLWVGPATITNAYLKNYSTGKYLEVHGASKADGANVDQWHYVSGASNEQWTRA